MPKHTKEDSYTVIKKSQLSNLTKTEREILETLLLKVRGFKQANSYYVINTDEPYAKKILDVILEGERQKRPDFKTVLVPRLSKYLGDNFTYVDYTGKTVETMFEVEFEDYPLAEPSSTSEEYMRLAQCIRVKAALKYNSTINSKDHYNWGIIHVGKTPDNQQYKDIYKLVLTVSKS